MKLNIYFSLLVQEKYKRQKISYELLLLSGQLDLYEGALYRSNCKEKARSLGILIKLVMEFMDSYYRFLDYSIVLSLAFKNYESLFTIPDTIFNVNNLKTPENLYVDLSRNIGAIAPSICRFRSLGNPTPLG